MAVTVIANGINQTSGVKYTVITDSSSDWGSVSNDTYFFDKANQLPYYKNGSGTVISIFESGGGNTIYTADGSLSGDRIVNLNSNDLDFKDGNLSTTLTSLIGASNPQGKFFSIQSNREGYFDGSLWFRNLNSSTGVTTPHHRFYSGGLTSYVGAGTTSSDKFSFGKTNNNSGSKFEMLAQNSGMFIHNDSAVTKSFLGLLHLYPNTGAGTVALNVENPVGSIIMARANTNREVIIRGTNVLGSETISLQGHTVVQGVGTSTGTTLALYDNDTTPNKTLEILDNGKTTVNFQSTGGSNPALVVNDSSGLVFSVEKSGSITWWRSGATTLRLIQTIYQFYGTGAGQLLWQMQYDASVLGFGVEGTEIDPHNDCMRINGDVSLNSLHIRGNIDFYNIATTSSGANDVWNQNGVLRIGTREVINPTVQETISTATFTINADLQSDGVLTAMATNTTIASPTGTPVQGQSLIFRFKDDGTARTLTWNAIFRAIGVTLPTTTTANKLLYVGCKYNSTDTKWDVVSVQEEA